MGNPSKLGEDEGDWGVKTGKVNHDICGFIEQVCSWLSWGGGKKTYSQLGFLMVGFEKNV